MYLIIFLLLFVTGCVTKIENRCVDAGMSVAELSIEDTGAFSSHAKVKCYKGK